MTFPITPVPGIHNDSINIQALEQQAIAELATLTKIFETFANQIILMVVNALLNAFGLSAFAGPIDEVISEFEHLMEAIPSGNIEAILGSLNLGADVQAIVDNIANALGIVGVGHDFATLVSALEAIPSGNIAAILGSLNLGADVQAIVDKIVNALGVGGSNHTLSALLAALQAIPGANIVGALTAAVTAGGASDIVAMIQAVSGAFQNDLPWILPITIGGGTTLQDFAAVIEGLAPATSLQHLTDTLYNTLLGNSALNWVSRVDIATLTAALHNVQATVSAASNTASAALAGVNSLASNVVGEIEGAVAQILPSQIVGQLLPSQIPDITLGMSSALQTIVTDLTNNLGGPLNQIGATFTNLAQAISQIPFANVLSPWLTNIGLALEGFANSLVTGLMPVYDGDSTGNNPAQIAQAGAAVANAINNNSAIAKAISTTIANQAITNPASWGIDPTASAPYPLSDLANLTTAPTINVTETATAACYIDTPFGGVKESIAFMGDITTVNLAKVYGFYINLYSVNTSTNVATWVWSSSNLASSLSGGTTPLWNYANIPVANYLTTSQGNKYMAELQLFASDTTTAYKIIGVSGSWLVTNTNVTVGTMGCSRTSGPCINQAPLARASASGPTGTKTPSWTHPYVSGDSVLVDLHGYSTTSAITAFTVTLGGITMNQLAITANYETTGFGYIATYGLLSSALGSLSTGNQTVAVATTGGGTTGTQCSVIGESVSYSNISAFGTPQTTSGSSAAPTQTVTGLTANSATIIHSVLTADGNGVGVTFGSPNQNTIVNLGASVVNDSVLIQDQLAYATSAVFSGTATSGRFGAMAVPLTSTLTTPLQVPSTTFTPTASNNIPWMAMCGAAGISQLSTAVKQFKRGGTFLYTIPTNYQNIAAASLAAGNPIKFDVVACGDGGGANVYGDFDTLADYGGGAGTWTGVTLRWGVDFPLTTTTFTINVGSGGVAGVDNGDPACFGGNGSGTSVVITGYGTISTPGGAGGTGQAYTTSGHRSLSEEWGDSPGDFTFNTALYAGGLLQSTLYSNGSSPGGGGSCGFGDPNAFDFDPGPAGAGAPGIAFITVYQ